MKNLRYCGEAYDTDEIISIELIENSTIKISMLDEKRHYFNFLIEKPEEAIADYDKLMADYHEAVAKRERGEDIDDFPERYRLTMEACAQMREERLKREELARLEEEKEKKLRKRKNVNMDSIF